MQYIAHRINSSQQLASVPVEHGIEVDLRDFGNRIVMQHDPFVTDAAEDFETLLQVYQHKTMILNIKSERIEERVLGLVQKYGVADYFLLDSSFPMIRWLTNRGESRIAMRFSELEPEDYALSMAGKVQWVWVDCFTHMPLTVANYSSLKRHFRICIVSPELQGRSVDEIDGFVELLMPFEIDAVCTKRPDLWKIARACRAVA